MSRTCTWLSNISALAYVNGASAGRRGARAQCQELQINIRRGDDSVERSRDQPSICPLLDEDAYAIPGLGGFCRHRPSPNQRVRLLSRGLPCVLGPPTRLGKGNYRSSPRRPPPLLPAKHILTVRPLLPQPLPSPPFTLSNLDVFVLTRSNSQCPPPLLSPTSPRRPTMYAFLEFPTLCSALHAGVLKS